jgi:hypothetical protein
MSEVRYDLGRKVKERDIYSGTFVRIGKKPGAHTILLIDITDGDGNLIADHIWLNRTERSKQLGWLSCGDRIQFEARVATYKRKFSGKIDYRLSHPTKFSCVGRVGLNGIAKLHHQAELNS